MDFGEHGHRVHKQIIVSGFVENPPVSIDEARDWFERLIVAIDMKILSGPHVVYCDTQGNRGITGVTIIETSHCAMHVWDEISPAHVELDVYSCKDFDPQTVVDMLGEFGLVSYEKKLIERGGHLVDL